MYNTLKEIQEKLSDEELNKHADALLGKFIDQVEDYFKENGLELSKQCIDECFDYLLENRSLSDEDLNMVSGGTGQRRKKSEAARKNKNKRFY